MEKTKLKSTLVHFSFPFTHPQLTHIPEILPQSLSSITLTEQAMPVRVEMKELQGRWMCAERVCEINECPPLSLIPIGDVLPGQKCQKRQHNYRSEWRSQCCVWRVQIALRVYSSSTPCSSDSRKTSNSAQQGCISMIIILFLTRHLVYILILWRYTPRGGGDPEKYTLFIHYSKHWQQGCPIAKRGDVIWQQMKRKSEAEFSELAQHYMFAWV